MLPTEEPKFHELVVEALALYSREPTDKELVAWWMSCKGYAFTDLDRALKAHADDADDGKRAPRPVDIVRRVKSGAREGQRCAARDTTGQCEYPGVFSDGTGGEGPWYCPWHRTDQSGPEASRFIEASRSVPYEVAIERRRQRLSIEGQRAHGVVQTAHAIALRHGNRPWQAREPEPINPDAEDDRNRDRNFA